MTDGHHLCRVLFGVAVFAHHDVRLVGDTVRIRNDAIPFHDEPRAGALALLFRLPRHEPVGAGRHRVHLDNGPERLPRARAQPPLSVRWAAGQAAALARGARERQAQRRRRCSRRPPSPRLGPPAHSTQHPTMLSAHRAPPAPSALPSSTRHLQHTRAHERAVLIRGQDRAVVCVCVCECAHGHGDAPLAHAPQPPAHRTARARARAGAPRTDRRAARQSGAQAARPTSRGCRARGRRAAAASAIWHSSAGDHAPPARSSAP